MVSYLWDTRLKEKIVCMCEWRCLDGWHEYDWITCSVCFQTYRDSDLFISVHSLCCLETSLPSFLLFYLPLWVDCFTFSVDWTVIKEMFMETQNMMHVFISYLLTSFIAILCHCLKFFKVGRQDWWTAKVQSLFPELRVNITSSQIGFQNQLSIYNYQLLWSLIRFVDVRQCYVCWKFVNSWRWTQCVESMWTLGAGHSVLKVCELLALDTVWWQPTSF